jgi:hypothetical protein
VASRARLLWLALALALALVPLGASAQQAPRTERIVLLVEVLTRDHTPVIACGVIGAQPRDVSARVLAVQEGTFQGDTILLSWPVCEFSHVEPGDKFKVRIVRRTGHADTPSTRYLVRWEQPVAN